LGANDGVVSVASIVVGVAAANQPVGVIVTAGVAGLSAGALSMASGEYVSVSTQRDTERVLVQKGELNKKEEELANPWHAAYASAIAFLSGGIIPVIAVMLPPNAWRLPVTFGAAVIVLIITGVLSAYAGGANKTKAALRVVLGGVFAMTVTYGVGLLFGTTGI